MKKRKREEESFSESDESEEEEEYEGEKRIKSGNDDYDKRSLSFCLFTFDFFNKRYLFNKATKTKT